MNAYTATDLNPPSGTLLEFDITNDSENYTVEMHKYTSREERLAAYYDDLQGLAKEKRGHHA